jgi:glycosyltransferase involved in cell wall biosynthesis
VTLDRPLRFVHVSTFFPPEGFGGDAVQVHRLATGLAARGHDVRVVHSPDAFAAGQGGPTEGLSVEGLDVTPLAIGRRGLLASYLTGRPLGFKTQLRELVQGADIVHFHNPSLIGGPGALFVPQGPLIAYTAHEHWLVCPTHVLFRYGREPCEHRTCIRCTLQHRRPPQLWRSTSLLERAIEQVDVLFAPSRFTADRHRGRYPHAPIEVLRHPPPAPGGVAHTPHATSRRPYVLFAGRLEPIKGAAWLVDALRDTPEVDVVIAGDGTQAAAVEEASRGAAHIRLVGKVAHDEVLRLAAGAMALVIPSVGYESAGAVGLEAMAMGTPLLVRDLGALPELVEDGGGLVFADAAGLRAAVHQLVDDATLARRLGAEAASIADPIAGDVVFFARYFELLAAAAARTNRDDLAQRLSAAAVVHHDR